MVLATNRIDLEEHYAQLAVQAYLNQLVGGTSDLQIETVTVGQYAYAKGTFVYAKEDVYSFGARVLFGDVWPKVGHLVVYLREELPWDLAVLHQTGEYVFQVAGDSAAPEIKSSWLSVEISNRLREN